jgi:voltage-gated potassium channel
MEEQPQHGPVVRLMRRRVRRKGFTPRVAASLIAFLWAVGVVVFGVLEHLVDPDSFDSIWLGMWWALQTVTTVGYGDVVPAGTAGKVIAAFLMLGGLSLFAVVTGAVTSIFVAQAQAERQMSAEDPVMRRFDELTAELGEIKADLARPDRNRD